MRRLFIDIPKEEDGPRPGDYVFSSGKTGIGTRYLVIESYRVKRHDPEALPRYQMKVETVTEEEVDVPQVHSGARRLFMFAWYPRKKKRRQTFEQFMRRTVDVR